jgi:O-acetyl-ADP-ribose deacetylase
MRPLLNLDYDLNPMTVDPVFTVKINQTILELIEGDITKQDTDAIVNAANSSLLGGGGVDGAIHRAAGPQLLQETRGLGGCETGDAKISGGYKLKARHVIHTVGPIYQRGDPLVPRLLHSAYHRSLEVAVENNIETIAFPAVSTGIYGYPLAEAAHIALHAVIDFIEQTGKIKLIRFVLFSGATLEVFGETLAEIMRQKQNPQS